MGFVFGERCIGQGGLERQDFGDDHNFMIAVAEGPSLTTTEPTATATATTTATVTVDLTIRAWSLASMKEGRVELSKWKKQNATSFLSQFIDQNPEFQHPGS
ncbi:hypothetical protein LOK49_LG01G03467 [Camellia lanceoleosa]|uniref:Uncharacterized protein n=1 Tax=Camellia lanceoleosa TaxID=1840588 RepID=A0ACC0IZY0_9ERIC|nr:hypothetical protein LOK49_LG01G03467 [Camellia lanceoleosa]